MWIFSYLDPGAAVGDAFLEEFRLVDDCEDGCLYLDIIWSGSIFCFLDSEILLSILFFTK